MVKLSVAAVISSIKHLTDQTTPKAVASAISCFLVGKRIEKLGFGSANQPTITIYNDVVDKMFGLIPGFPKGRLDPFRPLTTMWQTAENSGRKTVWNVASRGDGEARSLFNVHGSAPHPKGGLKNDAATILGQIIKTAQVEKPDASALAAIILRNEPVTAPITPQTLANDLATYLGISAAELSKFTKLNIPSPVDLTAGLDWDPKLLPANLSPVVQNVASDTKWHSEWKSSSTGEIILDDRIRQMVIRAIRSSPAVLLVGPPGTGKTQFLKQLVGEIAADPKKFGFDPINEPLVVTPDESWTTRELVGGETVVDGELEFSRGYVLNAIKEDRWLILDEMNRADMDRIFGGLFTWLSDSEVVVGRTGAASTQLPIYLGWSKGLPCESLNTAPGEKGPNPPKYLAGKNWRLLGTYNAVDAQRVFRLGHALSRRFVRVPISPLTPEQFEQAVKKHCDKLDVSCVNKIKTIYCAHYSSSSSSMRLGPAVFIRMLEYLRNAASGDPLNVPENAIAEAYAVNVGHYLGRLEPSDLVHLKKTIVPTAISEADWTWMINLVSYA